MADSWLTLLKLVLQQQRYLWAALVLGASAILAKRYGVADDLPLYRLYPAAGAGLFAVVLLVATLAVSLRTLVAKRLEKSKMLSRRARFGADNFRLAGSHDKRILLYYKERDQQRFRVVETHAHFEGMVAQGLLDRDNLTDGGFVRHYRIPDVIWRLLDDPPKGWRPDRLLTGVNWE
jgi:hypothetical protein